MILHKITKAQESTWYDRIAQYADSHGTFPSGEKTAYDMHHVAGRKYKHNKVEIGGWFILPIAKAYHDVMSNNPLNVTHYRNRYTDQFGCQRDQFARMYYSIHNEDGHPPIPDEVLVAILTTRY